jgi:myosin-6
VTCLFIFKINVSF